MSYQVSEKDMGIDRSFTDLWLSLSYNLLSPSRTIALILSVFFVADLTGATIDVTFILVMVIMVLPLSLSSTGTIAGTTIALQTLKLSSDKVGILVHLISSPEMSLLHMTYPTACLNNSMLRERPAR